jgi:hypothetical protein
MKFSNNEKELFFVFIPNIIYGFLFEAAEKYMDTTNFTKENLYFKNLYLSKLVCLLAFILAYKFLKDYFPKYSIVITAYLFNILLIMSDNSNISEFMEAKKQHDGLSYYSTLNVRIYVNYVFLAIWMLIIIAKIKKWLKKLKSCDIEVKEPTEVKDHTEVKEHTE